MIEGASTMAPPSGAARGERSSRGSSGRPDDGKTSTAYLSSAEWDEERLLAKY